MAEIETNSKKSVRVDMTPMVDLGFLLITFFVFTTTFTKPNMMQLFMPDKNGEHSVTKMSNTITFILGKDNRLFWHQSSAQNLENSSLKETNFSRDGVRKLILDTRKKATNPENFTIIIKPTNDANYKNTVDILDEMTITANKIYAIADLLPKEQKVYDEISLKNNN